MTAIAEFTGNELEVSVQYGIVGAGCTARMPRHKACGLTAHQLVESVLQQQPQEGSGHWVRRVLGEVLESRREVDVELHHGPDTASLGDPIGLHDLVVLPKPGAEQAMPGKLTVSISESYRGGAGDESWDPRGLDVG